MYETSLIHVYSWDPRAKKIHYYTGYYCPSYFNGMLYEAFLLRIPLDPHSWFRKIPTECGKFYNNAVWFTEPNLKKAQLIFIKAEIDKLKECKRIIQKAKENIEALSSYKEDDNEY